MAIGDRDMGIFFGKDFADEVTFNGHTAYGILDQNNATANFGPRFAVDDVKYVLELPARAFAPMPKAKDRIAVAGAAYALQGPPEPMEDGATVEIPLRKV